MDWRTLKRIFKILFKRRPEKKRHETISERLKKKIHLSPAGIEIIIFISLLLLMIPEVSTLGLDAKEFLSLCLLVLFFMELGDIFLKYSRPEVRISEPRLFLIGLSLGIVILICEIIQAGNFSFYLMPLAFVGMTLTLLIDFRVALFMLVLLDLLVCYLGGADLNLFTTLLIGSFVGSFKVIKIRERTSIIKAGIHTSFTTLIVMLIVSFLTRQQLPYITWVWAGLNGIISAFLTIGALPFFENIFGLTTDIRLMELADFNQPLLKKLMHAAPGTYHHSLLVADLAEESAEVLGINSLLVRVGAYYHDIGKLNHPDYFIENRPGSDNRHGQLNPSMSSLILINHIKDGIEMARRYHLPQQIRDIITQHHGMSLIRFFYRQAANKSKSGQTDEQPYRYPGPKPQTREAAVVMFADQVEAAAKTLSQPTPGDLEGLVEKIIQDNFSDGQLNQCNITLRDIQQIKESFTRVLAGIYHPRIGYPR